MIFATEITESPSRAHRVRPPIPTYEMVLIFMGVFLPLLLNGFYNEVIARSGVFYWPVDFVTWILIPIISMYLYRRRGGEFHDLGVVWPGSVFGLIKNLLYAGVWSIMLVWGFSGGRRSGEVWFDENYLKVAFSYGDLIPDSGWGKTAVWIHFSLTAGVVEELYFRGLLRRFFDRGRLGSVYFMVASTVLFSAIHWENGVNDMLATAAFGFLACICYLSHRSILVPMIAHVVADLILLH